MRLNRVSQNLPTTAWLAISLRMQRERGESYYSVELVMTQNKSLLKRRGTLLIVAAFTVCLALVALFGIASPPDTSASVSPPDSVAWTVGGVDTGPNENSLNENADLVADTNTARETATARTYATNESEGVGVQQHNATTIEAPPNLIASAQQNQQTVSSVILTSATAMNAERSDGYGAELAGSTAISEFNQQTSTASAIQSTDQATSMTVNLSQQITATTDNETKAGAEIDIGATIEVIALGAANGATELNSTS